MSIHLIILVVLLLIFTLYLLLRSGNSGGGWKGFGMLLSWFYAGAVLLVSIPIWYLINAISLELGLELTGTGQKTILSIFSVGFTYFLLPMCFYLFYLIIGILKRTPG